MESILEIAKSINNIEYSYEYSICSVVSNKVQYENMLKSFIDAGFTKEKCEYLFVDNSKENIFDSFKAFNLFLNIAKGKYIIICHQDIVLRFDNIDVLEERIKELDKIDSKWALIGNAGAINLKFKSAIITHGNPPVKVERGKYFPQKVQSLDENFILIKKDANLTVSSNLNGFHFYGTDICIIANILGYNAYTVNFHLFHHSRGNIDNSFFDLKKQVQKKYEKALKGRFIQTVTVAKFYISGNKFLNCIYNTFFARAIHHQYLKLKFILTGKY